MAKTDLGYSAFDVAKWFINATDREAGDAITHLKVQKLIYYAQGWALAYFDKGLFHEALEAWAHGPVAQSVYEGLKSYGFNAIPPLRGARKIESVHGRLLSAVNNKYGVFSAKKLEAMTHSEQPWIKARSGLPPAARCNNVISRNDMKTLFLAQKSAA